MTESEAVFGIPLKILFALIILLVAMAFTVASLLFQKGSAENIISFLGGLLHSFFRAG